MRSSIFRNVTRPLWFSLAFAAVLLLACCGRQELTAEKAQQIISESSFAREPIYAEVPQKVWWTPRAPKDEYDEKALRTLRNLEREGYVTVNATEASPDTATYIARVTKKGFTILGTAPSWRGPVYRAKIADKRYDGLRNFVRHPTEPTVGHAELIWHYENPTPMYALFETKIDKPLNKPYASMISFWRDKHQWKFGINVKKKPADASSAGSPASSR